jgi:chitinase
MSTTALLVAETVALGLSGSGSTDADGDLLSYSWDFGDQTSATGVSASHMYSTAGTYSVKLTVSDGKGGVGTATTQATVAPKPNSSSSAASVCTSPKFTSGTTYSAGQLVQNAGNEYKCNIAGWCSSTADWAYAPGTGDYWTSAWELVKSCGVSSSVPSSSSSSIIPSSSSSSSSSIGPGRYRLISGYWHNFNNGSGVIPLDQVSNDYDFINISFAEPTGSAPGHIGFVLDPAFDKASF